MLINFKDKIIGRLQWKYFIGEYKPKETVKLEKLYSLMSDTDQQTVREYRILLNTISENKTLRDELGLNPYALYSIGSHSFVNFKDPSNPVMYKVHDLGSHKTLFNEESDGADLNKIKKALDKDLEHDKNYVKNFSKGYIIIDLPNKVDLKSLKIEETYKALGFKSVDYDTKNNTIIIAAN